MQCCHIRIDLTFENEHCNKKKTAWHNTAFLNKYEQLCQGQILENGFNDTIVYYLIEITWILNLDLHFPVEDLTGFEQIMNHAMFLSNWKL